MIQIRYQVWYRLRSKWRNYRNFKYPLTVSSQSVSVKLIDWIDKPKTLSEDTFKFLNLSHRFENHTINWNFDGFGRLWNYNLNYMDFLLQPNMGKDRGMELINFFIQKLNNKSTGLEPYPISLRTINWIKFLTKYKIQDQEVDNSLLAQFEILLDNLEYNLLGNHLLENGFSLLFGAFYFKDSRLYDKAKEIIEFELNEQILSDGGHFELSPMYHQIILDKVLDCINLLQNNERFTDQGKLLTLMQRKGRIMQQWLNSMTFLNGQIPLLNDSTLGIAPSTEKLNRYATHLGIITEVLINEGTSYPNLKDSGYRRFNRSNYECIIDVGNIGPDYQPGHAHADTFSFELHYKGKPLITDTGISTYEKNERRQLERSTSSHNTVQVGDFNSSEVWGGFRIARRARVVFLEENSTGIKAMNNGFKHLGVFHSRAFEISNNVLKITDNIIGKNQLLSIARIHLHPDVKFQIINNIISMDGLKIEFMGQDSIFLYDYLYAAQYNALMSSTVIEITFYNQLNSIFRFN